MLSFRPMDAKGITPILNVSDISASFAWFEKWGWRRRYKSSTLSVVMYRSTSRRCSVLGFPPTLSINSLFPNDSFAQLISSSPSFCRISVNPMEVYHSIGRILFPGTKSALCGQIRYVPFGLEPWSGAWRLLP